VNKAYATKQGYAFRADKMSYEDMLGAIHPRTHCTWYKARMVLEELRRSLQEKKIDDTTAGKEDRIKLIMWIDADAMVINHDVAVQDVVAAALAGDGHGSGVHASALPARPITWSALPDLIVSADMSPKSVYPLNAGVLLVKVSEWSLSLWEDVWSHPASMRYASVYFYEQSALVKCLRMRHITLPPPPPSAEAPAAPYEGEEAGYVPHVVVVPCMVLNSNRIDPSRLPPDRDAHSTTITNRTSWTANDADLVALNADGSSRAARFIFHAVGQWNKLGVVQRVAELHSLLLVPPAPVQLSSPLKTPPTSFERAAGEGGAEVDASEDGLEGSGLRLDASQFRLRRGRCGGVAALASSSSSSSSSPPPTPPPPPPTTTTTTTG
jgi:hypothetical protein